MCLVLFQLSDGFCDTFSSLNLLAYMQGWVGGAVGGVMGGAVGGVMGGAEVMGHAQE